MGDGLESARARQDAPRHMDGRNCHQTDSLTLPPTTIIGWPAVSSYGCVHAFPVQPHRSDAVCQVLIHAITHNYTQPTTLWVPTVVFSWNILEPYQEFLIVEIYDQIISTDIVIGSKPLLIWYGTHIYFKFYFALLLKRPGRSSPIASASPAEGNVFDLKSDTTIFSLWFYSFVPKTFQQNYNGIKIVNTNKNLSPCKIKFYVFYRKKDVQVNKKLRVLHKSPCWD